MFCRLHIPIFGLKCCCFGLFFLLQFFYFSILELAAQDQMDYSQEMYDLYVDGEIGRWESVIQLMEEEYQQRGDRGLLYSICVAQYGYIGYCISEEKEEKAKISLKKAVRNVKELRELYYDRDDILALHGAFVGFRIMLSKFSAMYLAPKSYNLISSASSSSKIYYNCSLEMGNIKYFTPSFLGGSKSEAIDYYLQSIDIIESKYDISEGFWMYINLLLILANAYYDTGAKDLSRDTYQKIFSYEPDIEWIKEEYWERFK